jgi:hypothetical protein
LYSGKEPQFIEGADVFCTIIPLAAVATVRVGPQSKIRRRTVWRSEISFDHLRGDFAGQKG